MKVHDTKRSQKQEEMVKDTETRFLKRKEQLKPPVNMQRIAVPARVVKMNDTSGFKSNEINTETVQALFEQTLLRLSNLMVGSH